MGNKHKFEYSTEVIIIWWPTIITNIRPKIDDLLLLNIYIYLVTVNHLFLAWY